MAIAKSMPKPSRWAIAFGVLFGLVGGLAAISDLGESLEERYGLAWLFAVRGPIPSSEHAIVTSVDRPSAEAIGISPVQPWPRALHACLVEILSERGASVIAFDVFFRSAKHLGHDQPLPPSLFDRCRRTRQRIQRGHDANQILADAIRRAGNVLLLQEILEEHLETSNSRMIIRRPELPHRSLADAARAVAPFTLPVADTRLTRFHVVREVAGNTYHSMPLVAAQVFVDSKGQRASRAFHPISLQRHQGAANVINFYGPSGSICTIPFSALLGERFERGSHACPRVLDVDGKAVFVGAGWSQVTSTDLADDFRTAFSEGPARLILGVEVMATIFSNLLHGHTIRPLDRPTTFLLVALLSALFLLFYTFLSGFYAATATLASAILYLVTAQVFFNSTHLWLPVFLPVAVMLPLILLTGSLMQYARSRRALHRYVPVRVAAQVATSTLASVGAQEVFATCLCSDVQNYTALSERLTPAKLAELSNRYFSAVGSCVSRHEGEILDIVGDGMTAVWPDIGGGQQSCRLKTCLAALDIVSAVAAFNEAHPGEEFPTRMGLNSGHVAMGDFGGGGHFAYSVVGDIVNTASRIEGLNKLLGTRLLAAASTVAGLDDLLVRCVGTFRFKGKSRPYEIYQILDLRSSASAVQLRLCRGFHEAYSAFQERDFGRAAKRFNDLHAAFPNDGPTIFYRSVCRNAERTSPIIGLQEK